MANENPDWGASRIHGQLMKTWDYIVNLLSEIYAEKRKRTTRSETETFLKNHSKDIYQLNFFTFQH